jgi:hypothetical protein
VILAFATLTLFSVRWALTIWATRSAFIGMTITIEVGARLTNAKIAAASAAG